MDIKDYRDLIDDTDRQIVELLCKRAEYAAAIGKLKGRSGDTVYAPKREAEIRENALKTAQGRVSDRGVTAVMREVISACRGQEKVFTVAARDIAVAKTVFGECAEYIAVFFDEDAYELLDSGKADFALVADKGNFKIYVTLEGYVMVGKK
ncbi:MAG: chorismate mutase [Abditibacteriota bacterium]|nr:chorismate mutase [Abditibacteriota bacterium]MBP5717716.1 chorismate mutase [Abditibacteriota bacterium]MBP5737811.1 chorismate mutase [Abditibacteriota bacterium]